VVHGTPQHEILFLSSYY